MLDVALYIVATPIGNLSDLSPRAIETLSRVGLIAAEDTRHSQRLLTHFNINTRQISVHDHNERQRVDMILQHLEEGTSVALISDAGTPVISDPGYVLVKGVREAGHRVIPVPGCVAFITALCASGLPATSFAFQGFAPPKGRAREQFFEACADDTKTQIFYESCHRIQASLEVMASVFGGDRPACVARELTKTYETIKHGTLAELIEWVAADANQRKGEFVVIVQGAPAQDTSEIDAKTLSMLSVMIEELPLKQAAGLVAKITGIKKNTLYQAALELKEG